MENPKSTSGAEVLRERNYKPGSGAGAERGNSRWGVFAAGIVVGAVAIAPLAFVIGSRSGVHFVSRSELAAIANRPNEVKITARCITEPNSNSGRRWALIEFDQTDYSPVEGGVVLVGQTGDGGKTTYRHLTPQLTDESSAYNVLDPDQLKQTFGQSLALYHEEKYIDPSNLDDHFDPETDIKERLGYVRVSETICD